MADRELPTAEYVRQILDYDHDMGVLRWKTRADDPYWNRRWASREAGTVGSNGYRFIQIDGALFRAHRLAWLWMTGEWPKEQVDHIDCCRSNNRWSNLREASNGQNQQNARIGRNNTSGVKGVHWDKRAKKWQAQISINGKRRHVGFFATKVAAANAYEMAARKIYGEFARTE